MLFIIANSISQFSPQIHLRQIPSIGYFTNSHQFIVLKRLHKLFKIVLSQKFCASVKSVYTICSCFSLQLSNLEFQIFVYNKYLIPPKISTNNYLFGP